MKKLHLLIILTGLIITSSSCSKKDANSPTGIKFQLKATNTVGTLSRPDASTITWTSGTARPSTVKLEAKKGMSEIEYNTTANQQVDLFNVSTSTFGNVSLPADTYTEVELEIQLNGSESSPAMELNGSYNNKAVVFLATTPILVKSESNNVTITNGVYTAVTSLQLSLFTTGITENMMNNAVLTNGQVVISSTINSNLYNIIVNNIDRFHHAEIHH